MKKALLILLLVTFSNIVAQDDKINWLSIEEVEVLQQKEPRKVLMDVYTSWCGPCKMIGPSLEEISDEMADKITVAKVNIDENPETPTKYGVRGIPTMLVFKNGEAAATKVGAVSKTAIVEWIEDSIA